MSRQALDASTRLPCEASLNRLSECHTATVEAERALRVTLARASSGEFVIVEEREDGSVVLAPDTSMSAIRRRHGLVPATLAEFEAVYGPCNLRTAKVDNARRRHGEGRRRRLCLYRQPRGTWLLPEQLAELGDHV